MEQILLVQFLTETCTIAIPWRILFPNSDIRNLTHLFYLDFISRGRHQISLIRDRDRNSPTTENEFIVDVMRNQSNNSKDSNKDRDIEKQTDFLLFATSGAKDLATEVLTHLDDKPIGKLKLDTFADGEVSSGCYSLLFTMCVFLNYL